MEDSKLLEGLAAELSQVPAIPCADLVACAAAEEAATCTPIAAQDGAEWAQEAGGVKGHDEARQVTVTDVGPSAEMEMLVDPQVTPLSRDGTNGQGPAPCGTGPSRKRVKGVEPSTFTLAT